MGNGMAENRERPVEVRVKLLKATNKVVNLGSVFPLLSKPSGKVEVQVGGKVSQITNLARGEQLSRVLRQDGVDKLDFVGWLGLPGGL